MATRTDRARAHVKGRLAIPPRLDDSILSNVCAAVKIIKIEITYKDIHKQAIQPSS